MSRTWRVLLAAIFAGTAAWTAVGGIAFAQEASSPQGGGGVGQPARKEVETQIDYVRFRDSVTERIAGEEGGARIRFSLIANLAGVDSLIGLEVSPADDVLRSHLGLSGQNGLVVNSVVENGPAAKGGIAKNDILVSARGQDVGTVDALEKELHGSVGQQISLGLIRGGKRLVVEVTPVAPLKELAVQGQQLGLETNPQFWVGVGLAVADETLKAHLGLGAAIGLVVTSVEADSPAASSGVMVNDLVLKLDGKDVGEVDAFVKIVQEVGEKSVPLNFLRKGKPALLTVTPAVRPARGALELTFNSAIQRVLVLSDDLNLQGLRSQVQLYTGDASASRVMTYPAGTDLPTQLAEIKKQLQQLSQLVETLEASLPKAEVKPESGK